MMIFGQTRYLNYEVCPGSNYGNVFPQGLDLLRLHDAQCSFADISTAPGVYNWTTLDSHLDSCEMRGVQVLYTFCYTPEWAYDTSFVPEWPDSGIRSPHSNYPPRLDVFEEFFRALIAHVMRPDGTCRIRYWEAWNETNSLAFWNGTDAILMAQQQMLWSVIQEMAPSTLLTTPTPTKNFTTVDQCIDSYLQQGFQNYAHIVSFHGYLDQDTPGSAIGPTIEAVNAVMAKNNCAHPLWDTEWNWTQGYPDDCGIPMDAVPQWIKDALVARMQNNIACSIWYEWDNPNACGSMCNWMGEINTAGYGWIDLYNSVHPLPSVTELVQVGASGAGRPIRCG